ncbi:DUF551 domain-containing protein [Carnimonas bestiolae]|uniref:DUF551 domain-containing protein n=1 Tax=Carnimonas bestiolae TaxID=3402172 RepID=UPI003EDC7E92
MSDWIAIKDELPEFYRRVLTVSKTGLIVMAHLVPESGNQEKYFAMEGNACSSGQHVSHWMPLPKVPEVQA